MSKELVTLDEQALLVRFGEQLRRLRVTAGLTQEALAHGSGLDRSYVGQVERGERNVALVNIVKLATALSVQPSVLIAGVDTQDGASS